MSMINYENWNRKKKENAARNEISVIYTEHKISSNNLSNHFLPKKW